MFSVTIAHFLRDTFGMGAYFLLTIWLLFGAPVFLLATAFVVPIRGRRGKWFGLKIGFSFGFWASLCELCIPYLGMYPNIPGALLGFAIGVGSGGEGTWAGQLCIHGFNMVVWPLSGWLLFRFLGHHGTLDVAPAEEHL